MKKIRYITGLLLILLAAGGCIKKEDTFPDLVPAVTLFELQGMTGPAVINADDRVISVELAEDTDMSDVLLLNFLVSGNTTISPEAVAGESRLDLSSGETTYTLTTNASFVWTVCATRAVNRSVTADNMISSHINAAARSVLIFFSKSQALDDIHLTALKLGPEDAVTTPDPATVRDFTEPVKFTVTYGGVSEEWSVAAELSASDVVTGFVNPFALFVLVDGNFAGTGTPTFRYRHQGADAWTTFPTGDVEVDGTTFSARIGGLTPNTAYEVCAVNEGELGEVKSFTTETIDPVYNMGFEEWSTIKVGANDTWIPYAAGAAQWWDSGNKGANTLSPKNPTSPTTLASEAISGRAVKMASTKIVFMFAAGNLFTGEYLETIVTRSMGGRISFGRPYTSRPTRMTGWYNYSPGIVDNASSEYAHMNDGKTNDLGTIYILLADWDEPFVVNTVTKHVLDLERDPGIIALGQLLTDQSTDGYEQFSLELEYRSLTRIPKYILIVASASRYGDFFTGSTNSVLYVDEFKLEFD